MDGGQLAGCPFALQGSMKAAQRFREGPEIPRISWTLKGGAFNTSL